MSQRKNQANMDNQDNKKQIIYADMDSYKVNDRAWNLILSRVNELREAGETLESIGTLLQVNRSTIKVWLSNLKGGERTSFRDMIRYIDRLEIDFRDVFGEAWGSPTGAPVKQVQGESSPDIPEYIVREEDIPSGAQGAIVSVYPMAEGSLAKVWQNAQPIEQISIPLQFAKPTLYPVQVAGNSMEPTLHEGSYVGIDRADTKLVQGKVYGVYLPYEGIALKRVYLDHKNASVLLKSDNPEHEPISMPIEEKEDLILGRVVWVMQQV